MTVDQIDPEERCSRATKKLQECLIEEGQRLSETGQYQPALAIMFRAYALRPGVTPVLHSIGRIYEAMGDTESAIACHRGVIPEAAEKQYFNAASAIQRTVRSRKASNCQHLKTHRSESLRLRLPASNADPSTRPEFRAGRTESRGSFVSVMDSAAFWFDGFNTVVVDNEYNTVEEHIKGNACLIRDIARQRPERTISGTVCFLDARSSSIYYHWMMDVLPKVAILTAAGIDLGSIDHFVVRCQSDFQRQTLTHVGIPEEKLIAPWSEGLTRCTQLIVPYLKNDRGDRFYNGLGLGMARWVPLWLKSVFVNPASTRGEMLYISRASRGTRSPRQEQRLTRELGQRGVRTVTLETLSVTEQASLLSSATLVIAPHGAGLTNIAFCEAGTTVIELFDGYVVPCYWALSELAELDYHAYFARSPSPSPQQAGEPVQKVSSLAERRNQGMNLDVDDLLSYLDTLMRTRAMAS